MKQLFSGKNKQTKQTIVKQKINKYNHNTLIDLGINNIDIIIIVNFKYWLNQKCWYVSIREWRDRKYKYGRWHKKAEILCNILGSRQIMSKFEN